MFLLHFFTGSILGIIAGIIVSLIVLAVVLGATTAALMATGGPGPCEPVSGELSINQANSDAFQRKWDLLQGSLDAGVPAEVVFTESEVASRAESWANDEDVPFEDIRVCIRDGFGEGSVKVAVLGMDVKVKVKGTLDLNGDKPKASIDDISIGNVPGWMLAPAEAIVNRAIDDGLSDLEIDHDYTLELREGEAVVSGTP
jgi:hypothetical protein